MSTALATRNNGRLAVRHHAPRELSLRGDVLTYVGPGRVLRSAAFLNTRTGVEEILFYASAVCVSSHFVGFEPQNHRLSSPKGHEIWVAIEHLHDLISMRSVREVFLVGPVTESNGFLLGEGAWKCASS